MTHATLSIPAIRRRACLIGLTGASLMLSILLMRWLTEGAPVPPMLIAPRFSVAMLSGEKQAAQTAPETAATVAETATPAETAVNVPVVATTRETSLPNAVAAAAQPIPGPEMAKEVEVIPPAQVSMPGGRLMANDAPAGDTVEDPFGIKPRQVYIRLLVNEQGVVQRSGIVRSGGDPVRDNIILKAMRTRTYDTKRLLRVEGHEPAWQVDLVLDYGNNEFLP